MKDSKCIPPVITFAQSSTIANPLQSNRSDMFSLAPTFFLPCSSKITSGPTFKWNVYLLDTSNNSIMSIDYALGKNSANGISFDANNLTYGIYQFQITVSYTYLDSRTLKNGPIQTSMASQYVKVVPTGVAVFGFPSGMQEAMYGCAQQFSIDPGTNSIDFDGILSFSTLSSFKFYCRLVSQTDSSMFNLTKYSNIKSDSTGVFNQIFDNGINCTGESKLF